MPTSQLCSTVEHLFTATTDGIGPEEKVQQGAYGDREVVVKQGKVWPKGELRCVYQQRGRWGDPLQSKQKTKNKKQANIPHFFNRVDQKSMSFQTNKWLQRVEIRAVNHWPNNRADSSRSDIIGTSLCQHSQGWSKRNYLFLVLSASIYIRVCSRRRR